MLNESEQTRTEWKKGWWVIALRTWQLHLSVSESQSCGDDCIASNSRGITFNRAADKVGRAPVSPACHHALHYSTWRINSITIVLCFSCSSPTRIYFIFSPHFLRLSVCYQPPPVLFVLCFFNLPFFVSIAFCCCFSLSLSSYIYSDQEM